MTKNPDLYRMKLTWGMNARIAKALRLNRSHVFRVASGERRSPKVEAAIRAELKRIDRLVQKHTAKVRAAEASELERAA